MKGIGLRKGRKKALHFPAIAEREGDRLILRRLFTGEFLGYVRGNAEGQVYVAVTPGGDEKLLEIKEEGKRITAQFEHSLLILDNRYRAKNLTPGSKYTIRVVPRKRFYELFERGNIPAEKGRGKRSEPDSAALSRIEAFSQLLSKRFYSTVLDSAAGIKSYIKKSAFGSLVALNISRTALNSFLQWSPEAEGVLCDLERGLPFQNDSFDLVISDAVLEYIHNHYQLLQEYIRVLKKGGELVLLEPVAGDRVDFYPQDLWEVAIWRPIVDKSFRRESIDSYLSQRLEKMDEIRVEFTYPIWREHSFSQVVVRFKK